MYLLFRFLLGSLLLRRVVAAWPGRHANFPEGLKKKTGVLRITPGQYL